MSALGYVKNFKALGTIYKRRIVSLTPDGQVHQAVDGTGVLGVSGIRGAKDGWSVDVYLSEIQEVEFGAEIAAGDWLTSDAQGRAVPISQEIKAQPGTLITIGRAMEAGPEETYGRVLIQPTLISLA